jgi:cyclohexa-1,5-dienecarbonyl-CoA hydratase
MAAPLEVRRDREGRLLRLRLARPKANIVDAQMIGALDAALAEAAAPAAGAPALRGVLLDHQGPNFSYGASVEEHLPASCAAMLQGLHGLVLRMAAFPLPILVAAKGQCLGGGLEVAAAGHLLFAAPDARLGQPEMQLGVFAPAASCLLPERMGQGAADDLLWSGRSVDGREALRLGLVNAVAEDPEAAALAWFDEHLARKEASRHDLTARLRRKIAAVEEMYLTRLMATRDANEGLVAFLEKRQPVWEDR